MSQLIWPSIGAPLRRLTVDADTADAHGNTALVDGGKQFHRIYGLSTDTLLLIRPDGHFGHIATHDIVHTTRAAIESVTPHVAAAAGSLR
jgi:hypothetical protein